MFPILYVCRSLHHAGCDGEADVAFVFDASGSIHQERFPIVLDFAKRIVAAFEVHPDRTRVAAVKWSNNAQREFYLNTYQRYFPRLCQHVASSLHVPQF